jgi:hypothetical protein
LQTNYSLKRTAGVGLREDRNVGGGSRLAQALDVRMLSRWIKEP